MKRVVAHLPPGAASPAPQGLRPLASRVSDWRIRPGPPAGTAWESGPVPDAPPANRPADREDATENRETRAPAHREAGPRPVPSTSCGRRTTCRPPRAAAPAQRGPLPSPPPAPSQRPRPADRAAAPAAPCRETDTAAWRYSAPRAAGLRPRGTGEIGRASGRERGDG